MIVVISGPMNGYPDHNKPAFDEAQKMLEARGYDVINPANLGLIDGWGWSQYMRFAIKHLVEADCIHMLDGWEHSRGALIEKRIADELGMKHIFAAVAG